MDVLLNRNVPFVALSQKMEVAENERERECAKDGGSKHANLVRLAQITREMDRVEVPVSRALFTEDVKFFLENEEPQIFDKFQRLGELYRENPTHFFDQALVQQLLSEIQEGIKGAFLRYPVELLPRGILDHKGHLMVRSSGSEDGKIANAGGNISIAYVYPDPREILAAIGEVEASYFSVSSLQNRINGGENPFEEPLHLGVLVQPLVGEEVGGSSSREGIPVSMVLFTNEPSYVGGEAFRVMRINATYGHGEGVVGNKGISQDTIFVLQSQVDSEKIYVIYNNQPKLERLIPVRKGEKIELEPVLNEEGLRELPVLSYEEIKRLFDLGCRVESDYGVPMDMEIVVKNGVIYPVQARPINRKESKPTFVDRSMCQEGEIGEEIRANKVLVPGDLSARVVDSSALLIAPTLEEAEKQFKRGVHQFVVVSQDEPAQSHPVVNFSSMGIPCFYVENPENVRGKKLIICPQEGTMAVWNGDDAHPPFKEGYTAHPAPISVSVVDTAKLLSVKNVKNDPIPEDLKEAFVRARNPMTREEGIKALAENQFLKGAELAARSLKGRVSHLSHVPEDVRRTIGAIEKLAQKVSEATSELLRSAPKGNDLETLFHIKTLQQLIMQESNGIGQLSITRLPKFVTAVHTALDHQERLTFSGSFAKEALLGHEAISPRIQEQWNTYLERLENLIHEDPSKAPLGVKFQKLLALVEKTNSGASWMNLFFAVSFEKESNIEALTMILLNGFSEESTFLEEMLLCEGKIENEMANLGNFQKEATFLFAFERLKKLASSFQGDFVDRFQGASQLEKLIVQGILQKMIDLFDKAVKTAKMAPFMDERLFKEMTWENFKLLSAWADRGIPNIYLNDFEKNFKEAEGLLPSRDFSVQAATFGSEVATERHEPQTVEDCFTLIHQNLLALVERMGKNFLPVNFRKILDLPPTFLEMMSRVERMGGKLTRLSLENGKIKVIYNLPLRSHSAAFILEHDFKENRHTMQIWFYGDRRQRWDKIVAAFEALDLMGVFKIVGEPLIAEQEMSVTVQGDVGKLEKIFGMVQKAIDLGMEDLGRNDFNDVIQLELKKHPYPDVWNEKMEALVKREGRKGEFSERILRQLLQIEIDQMDLDFMGPQERKVKISEFFERMLKLSSNYDLNHELISVCNKSQEMKEHLKELVRGASNREVKEGFYTIYIERLRWSLASNPLKALEQVFEILRDPFWKEGCIKGSGIIGFIEKGFTIFNRSGEMQELWEEFLKLCNNPDITTYVEILALKNTHELTASSFFEQLDQIIRRNPTFTKDGAILESMYFMFAKIKVSTVEEFLLFKTIANRFSGSFRDQLWGIAMGFWQRQLNLSNVPICFTWIQELQEENETGSWDSEIYKCLEKIYPMIASLEEGLAAWEACAQRLKECHRDKVKVFKLKSDINSPSKSPLEKIQLIQMLIPYQTKEGLDDLSEVIQDLLKQMLPLEVENKELRELWEMCAQSLPESCQYQLRAYQVELDCNSPLKSPLEKLRLIQTLIPGQMEDLSEVIPALLKQMLPVVFEDRALRKIWEGLVDQIRLRGVRMELVSGYIDRMGVYLKEGIHNHNFAERDFADAAWIDFFMMHDWVKKYGSYYNKMWVDVLPDLFEHERLLQLRVQLMSELPKYTADT